MAQVLLFGGGLYGNRFALNSLRILSDKLSKKFQVQTILNGDFHWFDADPKVFRAITESIQEAGFQCTLGNVEKQLYLDSDQCGCNYPDYVSSEVPAWANAIYGRLQFAASEEPQCVEWLRTLDEEMQVTIGDQTIRIVHGEPGELNGWALAREQIMDSADRLDSLCKEKGWNAIACTHTCLPYLVQFPNFVAINNGALGMPNMEDNMNGIVGAISTERRKLPGSLCRTTVNGLQYSLLQLPEYDHSAFQAEFRSIWNETSPAFKSYWGRITGGTSLRPQDLKLYPSFGAKTQEEVCRNEC